MKGIIITIYVEICTQERCFCICPEEGTGCPKNWTIWNRFVIVLYFRFKITMNSSYKNVFMSLYVYSLHLACVMIKVTCIFGDFSGGLDFTLEKSSAFWGKEGNNSICRP